MATIKFTKEHEWISVDGDAGTVGITTYAQEQLGDIVFVELPEIGADLEAGGEAAVVESVKAASEIYTPAGGSVTEVNDDLTDEPAKINADAMGEGWIFKIKVSDASPLDDLMDKAAYDEYVAGLD
jgi:glycine cleavage system H protein